MWLQVRVKSIQSRLLKALVKMKIWWTWSGSNPTRLLIIRKLLILRIPRMPKMPTISDRLYVFCTVDFSIF